MAIIDRDGNSYHLILPLIIGILPSILLPTQTLQGVILHQGAGSLLLRGSKQQNEIPQQL